MHVKKKNKQNKRWKMTHKLTLIIRPQSHHNDNCDLNIQTVAEWARYATFNIQTKN